ncbi:hypothetical protein B0H13DRAFT_1877309 [Mycena leptocephala]|nr:hypothetical protein B0H13DRAFT_1877309 [Mycena leptocephala]
MPSPSLYYGLASRSTLTNPCLQLPMDVDPQSRTRSTFLLRGQNAPASSLHRRSPILRTRRRPSETLAQTTTTLGRRHGGVHHESGDAHTPQGAVNMEARSDLVMDSSSEDDDEDSAEAQARAYDREHYKMEVVQEEWDNISCPRLPALPSCSPTLQHRLDPLVTDAAHPQTRDTRRRRLSWLDEKYGSEGDAEDDLCGDAMVLWMPFTPPGFLAKSMTVTPERDQTPPLPDASSRHAPSPARDTSVTAAGTRRLCFCQTIPARASSREAEAPPAADFIRSEEDDQEHDDHCVIPLDVAKFFDLDAQDADSEEEDEPETPADKAFIDDASLVEGSSRHSHAPLFRFDDKNVEEMAADIEERWHNNRGLGLAFSRDPELYAVKVLPGTEYAFLVWLYGLIPSDAIHPHIVSAFYCPDSPGLVYVETTKTKTLYWALHNQLGVRVLDIVPVAQRPTLLDLPETGLHLLITRLNTGLVIPRIKAVEDEQEDAMRATHQTAGSRKVRPPPTFYNSQQAFSSPTFMGRVTVGNEKQRGLYGTGPSWMVSSLQLSASQVDQGNVRPTEVELDFSSSPHPRSGLARPQLSDFGAREGDRFVTKSSGPGRTSGYILAIRQRLEAHVSYIPVHSLDHHILRIPRLLEPLDRVIVVDGIGEMGKWGASSTSPDGIVTFQPVESPPAKPKTRQRCFNNAKYLVSLPMADLSICFQCGDWVEVTRGPRAQQKGFIISLRAGGVAEVYDFNALTLETIQYDHGDLTRDPNRMNDINWSPLKRRTHFYCAHPLPQMLADWGGVMPQPGTRLTETITNDPVLMTIVASNMAMKDKTMRDYITKNVYTGKGPLWFRCRRRSVAQKGPNKNSKDGESPETQVQKILRGVKVKSAWEGATMSIRLENSQSIVEVAIEHLEDRHKKMPLVQTAYVEWEGPLREHTPSPPPSRSPVWTGPDVPRDPAEQRALDAASAESNGEWLTQIELVDKRVDIVVNTLVVTPYWHANWSQAASMPTAYKTKKANTKLGLPLKNVGIPVNNLRPQRTMYDLHIHEGRESIAAVEVRVIIIGPDVQWRQDAPRRICANHAIRACGPQPSQVDRRRASKICGNPTKGRAWRGTVPSVFVMSIAQQTTGGDHSKHDFRLCQNPVGNDCGDEGRICVNVSGHQ